MKGGRAAKLIPFTDQGFYFIDYYYYYGTHICDGFVHLGSSLCFDRLALSLFLSRVSHEST